jgi:hypothetical protein
MRPDRGKDQRRMPLSDAVFGLWRTPARATDSAFVMFDVPPEVHAQYERITVLVRLGTLVLVAGSGMMFVALVIATFRGASGLRSWLVLPGALVLAAVFHLVDRRLTTRPPGAAEVPTDVADELLSLQELCEDIAEFTVDLLPPARYENLVRVTREQVAASITTATRVLAAERSGDIETSARLRAHLEVTAEELRTAHDALVSLAHDDLADPARDAGSPMPRRPSAQSTGVAHDDRDLHEETRSDGTG